MGVESKAGEGGGVESEAEGEVRQSWGGGVDSRPLDTRDIAISISKIFIILHVNTGGIYQHGGIYQYWQNVQYIGGIY